MGEIWEASWLRTSSSEKSQLPRPRPTPLEFGEDLVGGLTYHQGAVFTYRAWAEPQIEGMAKRLWSGSLVFASTGVNSRIRTGLSEKLWRHSFSSMITWGHCPRVTFFLCYSSVRGWLLLTLTGDLEESEHEFNHNGEVEFIKEQVKTNGSSS